MARWHRASAAASAASGGFGGAASPRRICTIFCTCALSAPPHPATASFTWFGEYCATSHPAAAASTSASPLAWPTLMAVRTFTWKNTRSTATASGWYSAMSARTSSRNINNRCGSSASTGVRMTPSATARALPDPSASMQA